MLMIQTIVNVCWRELQEDYNKLYRWNQGQKMGFNAKKYNVLEMGKAKGDHMKINIEKTDKVMEKKKL